MKPLHPKDPRGLVEWLLDACLTFVVAIGFLVVVATFFDPAFTEPLRMAIR